MEESGPERKRWGPTQQLPLTCSSVPRLPASPGPSNLAGLSGVRTRLESGGGGGGEGTWTRGPCPLGKQHPEGGIWRHPGKGRLAGAQGLPCLVPGPRREAVAMVTGRQVMVGLSPSSLLLGVRVGLWGALPRASARANAFALPASLHLLHLEGSIWGRLLEDEWVDGPLAPS